MSIATSIPEYIAMQYNQISMQVCCSLVVNGTCMYIHYIYISVSESIQGRMKKCKSTYWYAIFLTLRKSTTSYGRDGLMYKMREMGSKDKMWGVVSSLYANNRSCIFLEGKSSKFFSHAWL